MKKIYLRPHHGLCIKHYVGRGYDEAFTKNMNYIIHVLKSTPNLEIIIRVAPDALCDCCPNLHHGICDSAQKVLAYDQKCLSIFGICDNQCLSWNSFENIINEKVMKKSNLRDICKDCTWLSLCETI